MEISVKSKYLRVSPRKLRPVVNLVRGKNAILSSQKLKFVPNKGAKMVAGLINSALSVVKSSEINPESFIISSIACSDGPRLKRGTPTSKGSMMPITKRQSHLRLTISDVVAPKKAPKEEKVVEKSQEKKIVKKDK